MSAVTSSHRRESDSAAPPQTPGRNPHAQNTRPRRSRPRRALVTVAALALLGTGAVLVTDAVLPSTTSNQTFTMEPGSAVLSVDLGPGHVVLTASTSQHLEVHRTMRFKGRRPTVEERADARGARITSHCPALVGRVCEIRYEIGVPKGYAVDLRTSSGGVDARQLSVDKLHIEVSSGATHLEDVQGTVQITSSSGSITGTRLNSGYFAAHLASGSTNLDFAVPPQLVTVSASSGAVNVRLPGSGAPYHVETESGSGEEEIQVPTDPASRHRVAVSTGSGSITVLPR
jgi:hypothetical protein